MFNRKCISLFISTLVFCSSGVAQASDAEIAGGIKDPSGAPVASAKVTLTNEDSGLARTIAADSEGRYRFAVQPGHYALKTEAPGFRTETVTESGLEHRYPCG